jgi:hypothetical protein
MDAVRWPAKGLALGRSHVDVLDRLLGYDAWSTNQFLELSRGLDDA